jgi:hypothetical protein
MRVMVIVKATANSEAGVLPSEKMLNEMGKFNEELAKAGILLAGDGLKPSRHGKRILMSAGKRTVVDGPFAETKELIAGFWIWEVKSMDEALAWAQRCPDPMPGEDAQLELRPFYAMDDFDAELAPDVREHLRTREDRLRAAIESKHKA